MLKAMIEEALKVLKRGTSEPRFEDAELRDASGVEFRWTDVARWWSTREGQIHQVLAGRGVRLLPYPERSQPMTQGGRGNRASNCWRANSPDAASSEQSENINAVEAEDVVCYERSVVEASAISGWARRRFFAKGPLKRGSWLFNMLRWRVWLGAIAVMLFGAALLFTMLFPGERPVTTRDIALMIIAGACGYLWWADWRSLRFAFEDRIAPVPDDWLRETKPALLEWNRTPSGEVLTMVRYEAVCPICGATVRACGGEPDWLRRVVGRCEDAPREHVLTFDPVSHTGALMR